MNNGFVQIGNNSDLHITVDHITTDLMKVLYKLSLADNESRVEANEVGRER